MASKPCRAAPPKPSFIEHDREALVFLRRNIAALGEDGRAGIVPATRPARRAATEPARSPFSTRLMRSGLAAPALAALAAAGWLAPDALAIVEVAAREELVAPAGFTLMDERVYGAARLVFLRRDGAWRDRDERQLCRM